MGLRDFFVERVPSEVDVNDYEEAYTEETENVSVEGVSQESLIRDIYDQNELSDQSQSIFKIEEVINTLPKEMPTGTKRNAVAGMLSVFGLSKSRMRKLFLIMMLQSKIANLKFRDLRKIQPAEKK